jgi:adenylylsulfate kinase
MLADQGQIVVCCTISLFHEVQLWNRENIIGYKEVFIDVPLEVLAQRDQKNLYSRAARGEVSDVVGYDIAPEFPEKPDFIVNNSGSILPEEQLAVIWKALVAPTLL